MSSEEKPRIKPLVVGWREWVALPGLGIRCIKAKIDTGARSSSLHAIDVKTEQRDGKDWVRFRVHPLQRNSKKTVDCEAEVFEYRSIKSSTGHAQKRPVILTTIELHGREWTIELTLANRTEMGFRMLLGREGVRGRYLVDPGQSYFDREHVPRRKKRKKSKDGAESTSASFPDESAPTDLATVAPAATDAKVALDNADEPAETSDDTESSTRISSPESRTESP